MKTIYIIHGWEGSPEDAWIPWAAEELRGRGYKVVVPEMPDSAHPTIDAWVGALERLVTVTPSEAYFIGHSIGCQAIMRYALKRGEPIAGAVFVAGWFTLANLEDDEARTVAAPWLVPFDIARARTLFPRSVALLTDNDPFVPLEANAAAFKELGSRVVVVPGGGHFASDDGCFSLHILIKEFRAII